MPLPGTHDLPLLAGLAYRARVELRHGATPMLRGVAQVSLMRVQCPGVALATHRSPCAWCYAPGTPLQAELDFVYQPKYLKGRAGPIPTMHTEYRNSLGLRTLLLVPAGPFLSTQVHDLLFGTRLYDTVQKDRGAEYCEPF